MHFSNYIIFYSCGSTLIFYDSRVQRIDQPPESSFPNERFVVAEILSQVIFGQWEDVLVTTMFYCLKVFLLNNH